MRKTLRAIKCKDGWVVEVIRRYPVSHEQDVKNIARYEGLEIQEQFSKEERIYAE